MHHHVKRELITKRYSSIVSMSAIFSSDKPRISDYILSLSHSLTLSLSPSLSLSLLVYIYIYIYIYDGHRTDKDVIFVPTK